MDGNVCNVDIKILFSIIIPIYKVEKYLNEAIDSVLMQTFKDYELILVDDGSPDKCGEICDEYSQRYSFIRTFHKQNGGLSDARNYGLQYANGEYIIFLDSDDKYATEDFLKNVSKEIENHKPDMVIWGRKTFLDSTNKVHKCI